MKNLSSDAITKKDLESYKEEISKKLFYLQLAVAGSFILNVVLSVALHVFGN